MPGLTTDIASRPFQTLDLPEAEVVFYPAFFPTAEADRLLEQLVATTEWRQDAMKMFGEWKPLPRLTAWYGDAGARYVYSGIVNEPLPWTAALAEVKDAAESATGVAFDGVLLNRYRTGRDSMGWHADDEPEFGDEPVIASVSFGGTRTFQLKHKKRKELKASVELTHGSLLVMRGGTQANWLHQVPKTAKPVGERLNLTFRRIVALGR
jgi:alkylated DNA repair dioxygenase AlkB